MKTVFMNSGNSKTSKTHRLLLNLSDKINLRHKYIDISNLSIFYKLKDLKKSYKKLKKLYKNLYKNI